VRPGRLRPPAAPAEGGSVSDQAEALFAHPDWRARIAALELPEDRARELRVQVLRRRVFGATVRHEARRRA
jgi:hypothetical protein